MLQKREGPHTRINTYENKLLILLSGMFGFVLFDRLAMNYLVPFFDKELRLTQTQIGGLNASLAFAWAVAGYVMGRLSDITGKRKQYLLIAISIFSICSCLSGLATNFSFLLSARILMGLAEGPVLPLAQSLMEDASTDRRRGLNMGLMQSLGSSILAMLAPIVLVTLATHAGWRNAFFIAGIPGLLLAAIGFFYIRETAAPIPTAKQQTGTSELLQYRNVWVSILIAACMMGCLAAQVSFIPQYLIAVKGFSPGQMAQIMTAFGLGAIGWGIVIPALAEKFGRKPVLAIFFLLAAVMPAAVIYPSTHFPTLLPFVIAGSSIVGCFPVVLATIPAEAVPRELTAQTLGLVMGMGELAGGVAAPLIAGWTADKWGMGAPFYISAGASLFATATVLLLTDRPPS